MYISVLTFNADENHCIHVLLNQYLFYCKWCNYKVSNKNRKISTLVQTFLCGVSNLFTLNVRCIIIASFLSLSTCNQPNYFTRPLNIHSQYCGQICNFNYTKSNSKWHSSVFREDLFEAFSGKRTNFILSVYYNLIIFVNFVPM